jgi:hypothetical protein
MQSLHNCGYIAENLPETPFPWIKFAQPRAVQTAPIYYYVHFHCNTEIMNLHFSVLRVPIAPQHLHRTVFPMLFHYFIDIVEN